MKRIQSIDIIRGLAMIIMALDHVRDLLHADSITQSPTDLATTNPILFFTRWITYLCAPIFVFLAGTSVYLSLQQQKTIAETRQFLFKRGIWLLVLEFTIVNFGLYFDVGFHTILFEVIAAIGFGFIILGSLLSLSCKTIGLIGLSIIVLHNLTPIIPFADDSLIKLALAPFFSPTAIPLFAGKMIVIGYPPIPWLGIMLVGYFTGHFFYKTSLERKTIFKRSGLVLISCFIILRFMNFYGDSTPWTTQNNWLSTVLSFMNITKYPPSLMFSCITIGIMLLLLAYAEQFNYQFQKVAIIFGKVPLFYFVIHFYLIHFITLLVLLLQGFNWSQLEFATGTFGRPKGIESGLQLWAIYIIWILVVTAMYFPCKWFGKYKSSNPSWWIKYL